MVAGWFECNRIREYMNQLFFYYSMCIICYAVRAIESVLFNDVYQMFFCS
jgi:hypothetical protein